MKRLGWTSESVGNKFTASASIVIVASWAQESFKKNGPNNSNGMILNRDYFIDNERVLKYVRKYGANPTETEGKYMTPIMYYISNFMSHICI